MGSDAIIIHITLQKVFDFLCTRCTRSRVMGPRSIHVQDGALMQLASGRWLLAGGLSSSLLESLHGAAWASSRPGGWLPLEQVKQERGRWKLQYLLWRSLRNHTLPFLQHPIDMDVSPIPCGRQLHKGVDTGRWESIVAISEAGYHSVLTCIHSLNHHNGAGNSVFPYSEEETLLNIKQQ